MSKETGVMAEVTLDKVPQKVRDMFNRGFAALERSNFDYAMEMMGGCLEIEPALLKARKFLLSAAIQKRKAAKGGAMASLISSAKGLPQLASVSALITTKQNTKALSQSEKLLRLDPLNPQFVLAFADAAEANELPEAAVLALQMLREHMPNHFKALRRLADLYVSMGNTEAARDCFERLNEMKPNDPELVRSFKNAMATHSMQRDGWKQAGTGGSYRDIMKDTGEATRLEKESKAVKSDRDAEALIADTLEKIQAEPDNVTFYRNLGRLYAQTNQFEEAISTMEEALRRSPGDPELDQMLSNTRLQQMDYEIRTLRDAGDEEAAVAREQEKSQFLLSDLEDRVKRYPNDLRMRYDYGVSLAEAGRVNDAIQQFQAAQRSPKHRTRSLYYLALCFREKQQYDLASQALVTAAGEIPIMDGTKKDILYELGSLYELMGNREEAVRYFKDIYQVDIGYRDVADKVERMYRS
jgi:tetratricopeptide (TPR) repeat protein